MLSAQRPRMAWIILMFFSSIRITAGILVIISEKSLSTGVTVASIIFLNTGVFPLIAATLGFIRIIMALERDMSRNRQIHQCLLLSRALFFVGIGLAVAGGALEGSDTLSDVLLGVKLVKAGYIDVVVFVGCLLTTQVYFWTQHSSSCLSVTSRTILKATALATPFIIVRIIYLFLSVYRPLDMRWNNSLNGQVAPFLTMGLLMEYAVVCIYLVTGFLIPSWRNIQKPESRALVTSGTEDD
ncbi:hypothetical protein BDW59DRAFT_156516 [Aspergillus cavernicola]|uniref:DUF7702 domain-containing protein n=1 Tax=Aspergillus cavernicola TaxID=176166 RepID=A0ABR4J139_9EURO